MERASKRYGASHIPLRKGPGYVASEQNMTRHEKWEMQIGIQPKFIHFRLCWLKNTLQEQAYLFIISLYKNQCFFSFASLEAKLLYSIRVKCFSKSCNE